MTATVPRILVVEDEATLGEALERGLTADGCSVVVASDGADGLWHATEERYDAIVLDLMLPTVSGDEICARLRAAGDWTPILMLTARYGEEAEATGLDLGADDYLTKPFSYAILLARLRAMLRRTGANGGSGPLTQAGDLALDRSARRAWRGDVELSLTVREFDLLAELIDRAGQVISKGQLLEAVWDPAFAGDVNVVEVYVGYLRRKVDQPFGRASIETVRGAGYRLAADGG